MEEALDLASLCRTAGRIMRTGGRFAVVFRPERMAELFTAMQSERITPKRLRPLSHRVGKEPYAILVEGVKEGGMGLAFLPTAYQEEG